jgi:hypothetical protein
MARNLQPEQIAYIPCALMPSQPSVGVALYKTKILEVEKKKVKVQLRNGDVSDWIGSSLVHRNIGILILNIGDFASERTLLDPLAKSIHQFCRLLVGDDFVLSVRIRSLAELRTFWLENQAAYTHVIWIGHGSETALRFGVDGMVGVESLTAALRIHGAPKKIYISLVCEAGRKGFGSVVSGTTICRYFIGPFGAVEGAIASQFCQTFLASHLLNGTSPGIAFKHARRAVPGGTSFRLWLKGRLKVE